MENLRLEVSGKYHVDRLLLSEPRPNEIPAIRCRLWLTSSRDPAKFSLSSQGTRRGDMGQGVKLGKLIHTLCS